MPKIRQNYQKPSTPSGVNGFNLVSAGRDGRKRKKSEYFGNSDNPLLNNLVLATLFKYVEGKDLKTCRLVCKEWTILTLPLVRSQFQVTIFGTTSVMSVGQRRKIPNFMELIDSNTLGIPFTRFLLVEFDTTQEYCHQFVQTCGSLAKEINLSSYKNFQRIEDIRALLKSSPKLESFTMPSFDLSSNNGEIVQLFPDSENAKPKLPFLNFLCVGWKDWKEEENICPTFYVELFQAAENISTLDLGYGVYDLTLEVLETIENLGRESSIENLTISDLNDEHFDILWRMARKPKGLKLKRLYLSQSSRNHFLLFEVVELFKNSLIVLRVNCSLGSLPNSTLIKFPCMPKLKRLHLSAFDQANLCCENFGSAFPVLEKLCIDFSDAFNVENNFLIGDEPCPTYKSSVLRCVPIRMENLNRILTIFPTLKFLECEINDVDGVEVINKIWVHMTELEGLSICSSLKRSQDLDSLVTGISVKKSKKMEGFFDSLQHDEYSDREVKIQNMLIILTKNSKLPSIRNLTNLRSLTLKSKKIDGKISRDGEHLTDVSGYFGLYFLKNLKHLHISDCELSRSCCQILAKDLGLLNRKFMSTSNREIIPTVWNYKSSLDYPYSF